MRPIAKWRGLSVSAAVQAAGLLLCSIASGTAQSGPSLGTNPPCVLDKCLTGGDKANGSSPQSDTKSETVRPTDAGFGAQVAPGAFDFYVLSLSWSPAFCQTSGASHAGSQCEPGRRLGFVVHGLWPQNTHGYPSDCDGNAPNPSRAALDIARNIYPDIGLARHEWRKHGTCTGLNPTAYFNAVGRARAAIVIPEAFREPDSQQTVSPMTVARAFAQSNPRLRTDAMAVTCRSNTLEEVRICFSKDLRSFVSCPEVARASCRRPIEVPPVL